MSCKHPSTSLAGADIEPLLEIGIPGLRQVGHRQHAVENLLLEFIPQHDVHGIGEFIRVHANQTAFHAREMPVEIVLAPFRTAHLQYLSSSGFRYFTKERLRHRFISNSSDWLSSSARPRSRPTG